MKPLFLTKAPLKLLLFILLVCNCLFAQNSITRINNIDSLALTNNVYRFYLTNFEPSLTNPLDESSFDETAPILFDKKALKSTRFFEELKLMAIYDLNYNLIRLDGYEQRSTCGIQYHWYFEKNLLTNIIQTRHGFMDAKDENRQSIIKEIYAYINANWSGNREIQLKDQPILKQSINSIEESFININSQKLISFISPLVYKFIEDDERFFSIGDATNFDFKLQKSKYFYTCLSNEYNVKNLLFTSSEEPKGSTISRFLINGKNLKYPQYFTFRNVNSYEEAVDNAGANGSLKVDGDYWCIAWEDVNFDGYKDFNIYSNQNNCYYIYNPQLKLFEFNPLITGNQIVGMDFNAKDKTIEWATPESEDSKASPKILFKWDNGYLRKIIK